ncbi:MAG: hypothetical protein Q4C65_04910 [Eubacteriales bacterium]|nr:hypothetical protein [Eubacteriales bacterium]
MKFLNDQEKALFLEIVARNDGVYDEKEHMPTQWRGENGYHSRLVNQTVHSTVHSFEYALDLMYRRESGDLLRAEEILNKVLPMQDTDPSHKTYGIWPYFLEETLEEMNPPDWNWADFCGKKIMQMLLEFKDQLSPELIRRMETALIHACHSIIRRDMDPGYTNISIMGTYVTLVSGEYFQKEEFITYAKKRLRKLHQFNMEHGAFQEYNSPSYTWIVIHDIAAMLRYVHDEESRKLTEDLNRLAWGCLAEHYHYQTKQWAGPHSRFYAMLSDDQLLMQVQRALDYQIHLVPLDKPGLSATLPNCFFSVKSKCPEEYLHHFMEPNHASMKYNRYLVTKDGKGDEIAASFLTKEYTLGTFYKSTFWNQHRSHISYFDTEQGAVYCDLKCLHNGYDYSSGLIATAQKNGKAVSITGFATDGGDTHPNLDLVRDACIDASDLRLRFELGGAVKDVKIVREKERGYRISIGKQDIVISIPYAAFGNEEIRMEISREAVHVNETGGHRHIGEILGLDLVFWSGTQKKLCFGDLKECVAAIAFEIVPAGAVAQSANVEKENGMLKVSMGELRVQAGLGARTLQQFKEETSAWIGEREYRTLV